MLLNIPLLEWIGYVGSVIVAVSLTMSSIKKLRWYNLIGAAIFAFYGFAIGALPVGFLNLFISLADIYYLYKIYDQKESFKSILVEANDPYLSYFLDFYQQEINHFFPEFNKLLLVNETNRKFVMLLLRNAVVTGVFFGIKENNTLNIQLDFVTAPYRDLKPGDFIYRQNSKLFAENSIEQLVSKTDNQIHKKYLHKMGFNAKTINNSEVFVKELV